MSQPPVARSTRDLSGRRLEVIDAYRGGATVTFQVAVGWPGHLEACLPLGGFHCALCACPRWHDGPPAVWLTYSEDLPDADGAVGDADADGDGGVDVEVVVGAWDAELCATCLARVAAAEDAPDLVGALGWLALARREFHDARETVELRMKEAQLESVSTAVAAILTPLLAALGCDRESARRALLELGLTEHTALTVLDDPDSCARWCG